MGDYLNPLLPRFEKLKKSKVLIELKYDKSAESAITQIKEKNYLQLFKAYKGEVLLVGINYSKDTKTHQCIIEKVMNG